MTGRAGLVPGGTTPARPGSARASARGLTPWFARSADTEHMPRSVNWVFRAFGVVWIGLLTFLVPSREASGHLVPYAVPVQVAGYSLLVLTFLAWALIDYLPAAALHFARWLAVILGVMAVASGFASAAGGGGTAMVAFAFVAGLIAGGDFALATALAVTAAGVLAIEVSGLAFGAGIGGLIGLPLGALGR